MQKSRQEETLASISGAIPLSSANCTPVPHPWRRSVKGIYLTSCKMQLSVVNFWNKKPNIQKKFLLVEKKKLFLVAKILFGSKKNFLVRKIFWLNIFFFFKKMG